MPKKQNKNVKIPQTVLENTMKTTFFQLGNENHEKIRQLFFRVRWIIDDYSESFCWDLVLRLKLV